MKALVTGATGFIGKHLVKSLKQRGYEVYCLVRKTSNITNLLELKSKIIYGDITLIDSLYPAVKEIDYIYHLASAKNPKNFDTYLWVDYLGTKNLVEACISCNSSVKKFIYVSSLSAAGCSHNGSPLKETDPAHPITHYGKSKLKGEEIIFLHKNHLPVTIMRTPTVFGEGNMFFNWLLNIVKLGIKPVWKGYTSLCYIDDLIKGLILIGETEKAKSNLYYICDGNIYSWTEIINSLIHPSKTKPYNLYIPLSLIRFASSISLPISKMFKKPQIHNKLSEIKHPYWLCDASKIKNELGFHCEFNLRSIINLKK